MLFHEQTGNQHGQCGEGDHLALRERAQEAPLELQGVEGHSWRQLRPVSRQQHHRRPDQHDSSYRGCVYQPRDPAEARVIGMPQETDQQEVLYATGEKRHPEEAKSDEACGRQARSRPGSLRGSRGLARVRAPAASSWPRE